MALSVDSPFVISLAFILLGGILLYDEMRAHALDIYYYKHQ